MSYRTRIQKENGEEFQILGNNESYGPLLKFLEKQGCKIDDDCYKRCEIEDINGLMYILENYIEEKCVYLNKLGVNIYDLSPDDIDNQRNITARMLDLRENAFIFVTANMLEFFKEEISYTYAFINNKMQLIYTINKGKHIYMSAW
jgi:hypothetical protein